MTISTDQPRPIAPISRPPRLIEIALILSLALNCFVVGGVAMTAWHFTHHPRMPPPPEMDADMLARDAGLSEDDAARLVLLIQSVRSAAESTKSQNYPMANAYITEISKKNPSKKILDQLENQIRANKISMHEKVSNDFFSWITQLSFDKRQSVIRIIRDQSNPSGHGLRWIIGM